MVNKVVDVADDASNTLLGYVVGSTRTYDIFIVVRCIIQNVFLDLLCSLTRVGVTSCVQSAG